VLGVNAISGIAKDVMTPPDADQDYIVAGLQPWIDGVATEPGVVRQVCHAYFCLWAAHFLVLILQIVCCYNPRERLYSRGTSDWKGRSWGISI
jgi:hypothetical protein